MDIWFGWSECYVDDEGMPSLEETKMKAPCFVLFTRVIWVGEAVSI